MTKVYNNTEEIKILSKKLSYNIQKALEGKNIEIASHILFSTLSIVLLDIIQCFGVPINEKSAKVFIDSLTERISFLIKNMSVENKLNNEKLN